MLLAGADVVCEVRHPDIDETPLLHEHPIAYVRRLAKSKAEAVLRPGEIVVAADTTIDLDGQILEKPLDLDDARSMLRALSGRAHQAHTGVCVLGPNARLVEVVTTTVMFVELTDAQIDWYVETGEPMGKAGAYAIQERGAAFVRSVNGSVTNVVGLPLAETLQMLHAVSSA
jgi:septum formation protein